MKTNHIPGRKPILAIALVVALVAIALIGLSMMPWHSGEAAEGKTSITDSNDRLAMQKPRVCRDKNGKIVPCKKDV